MQVRASGPAGRADGGDDLPLRNCVPGFDIECAQVCVHRLHAVFMLQRHMIAVGFAVAAIQHRSGRDGQHILSRLGFEINAAVKRFLLRQRVDCPAIRIRHGCVRVLQRPDVGGGFCFRLLRGRGRSYNRVNVNDRLINRRFGCFGLLLHGGGRFRDACGGLRLRCKHACGKQEQHGGQCACPDRQSAEAQNRADALLRTAFCKAAAKGRGLCLPLRHVKKRQRVGLLAGRAERTQNGLVAGQLHIAVRKAHHNPNQRVPPVQAQTDNQQQLAQAVFAADMRQLMCQNKLKLRLTGRQIVRQQYRRAENAERQRGAAAFGHTDLRVAQKAEPIKQRVDGRLRQNAPGMEPARHADIAGCKIRGKQRCDPEPEQQPPVRPRSGGGRGLRRRKLREGEQRRRNGRGLRLRRAAQQVPDAQPRRDLDRQQEPNRGGAPERREKPSGQMIFQRQPQREDQENQRASAKDCRLHTLHASCASTSARSRASSSLDSERSDKIDANSSSAEPPKTLSTSESASSFCTCRLVIAAWQTKFGSRRSIAPLSMHFLITV